MYTREDSCEFMYYERGLVNREVCSATFLRVFLCICKRSNGFIDNRKLSFLLNDRCQIELLFLQYFRCFRMLYEGMYACRGNEIII